MDFNIRFSGDYDLFKWIIAKYKTELPYCGKIGIYTVENHYSKNNSTWFWKERGVPTRAWNSLWKDLLIARLVGKIKENRFRTLEQLREEFNGLK